jgi:hypothetical protein
VKVWAAKERAHLGLNEPKIALVVHLNQTVERALQANKTEPVGRAPPNPSPQNILDRKLTDRESESDQRWCDSTVTQRR